MGEERHFEIYFDNPQASFKFRNRKKFIDANEYLRIRQIIKEEDNVSVKAAFKRVHRDSVSGENVYCDEIEFKVEDFAKARSLFNQLGYTDETKLKKLRKKYVTDDFEISVDDVKGLGVF